MHGQNDNQNLLIKPIGEYVNDLCIGCHTYREIVDDKKGKKVSALSCHLSLFNTGNCPCIQCIVKVNCVRPCQDLRLWAHSTHSIYEFDDSLTK